MKKQFIILMTGILFIVACGKTEDKAFVCGDTITDIDGNVYHTVSIGSQCWTVENLKTTKFNDGTSIPNITDNALWFADTIGAYCLYNNMDSNNAKYGKLYNWYAVNTSKLAPTGWHVPTDSEWTTLTTHLGGSVAGDKMKSTSLWTPYSGIVNTNSSGFTGLPGGDRYPAGGYADFGGYGAWWSSTEGTTSSSWYRYLYFNGSDAGRSSYYKSAGFSVRCVKD